jgi:hypothetical protein
MSLTLATIVRNKAGDTIVDMIDVGTLNPNGYIEFRTATKPANPQTAAPGVLLATLRYSNPAYGSFSNGQAVANPIAPDENVAASGVCGWFRVYNCDGTPLWDGEVTVTGGGGDIEFDNINFIQGGTVNLTQLDAIYPE